MAAVSKVTEKKVTWTDDRQPVLRALLIVVGPALLPASSDIERPNSNCSLLGESPSPVGSD